MDSSQVNATENRAPAKGSIPSSVLITGGTGLVGRYLTDILMGNGIEVRHLSRNPERFKGVKTFGWNPGAGTMDARALEGIDAIVHLAGANIGEKRWSKSRKSEILQSRTGSAALLSKMVAESGIRLKAYITASATGYYGANTSDTIFTESDQPAGDFLGSVCKEWEKEADRFEGLSDRVVKIRSGVALEKSDSAMAKLLVPARLGIFPVTGNGKQYMPWIHIDDLAAIYFKAVTDPSLTGVYNAVSPGYTTHREFMKSLAKAMGKPFVGIWVPSSLLKIAMGESAVVILEGSRVSPERINEAGYMFRFPRLDEALSNLLS